MNKVQSVPSLEDKSLLTSSISNFFGNIITFISEDEICTSQSTKDRTTAVNETTGATTNMSIASPSIEPLSVSPSKLNTISTLRDTVGNLEAEFTQFQIVSSGDIQQLKDKIVQQDNLLKLQKKTIDEIVCDLSTQVKSTNDELRQHSLLLKKLQEDNHSLHKKNTKLAETSEDLLRKQTELEKEVVSLREQVMNLQQKPSEVPVS